MPQRQPLYEAIRIAADPITVLQRIVQQALVLLPQADGASLEIRRDLDVLEYLATAGSLEPHVGLRLPVHGSLSGLSVLTGKILVCSDALLDPRVDPTAVAATGIRSMLCVPLADQPGSVAVLKVASTLVGAFTNDDAARLQILTRFLNTTVSAASELAGVTADVLGELDSLDSTTELGPDWQQATAQFVANVTTPGLVDRVNLQRRVEAMLQDMTLDTVFQPVVDLQTGQMVGCEALTRFHSPHHEPPDWWFAAAEQVGLGMELELMAVRRALELLPQMPAHLQMAVNVGPATILNPEFLDLIQAADLHRLTVELTEHNPMQNYAEAHSVLRPLRDRGLRLSVDDTGSGYSGLTHILRLRPDVIKLDREMVTDVHSDPVRRALATAIVAFAEAIGAHVIAEGLEQSPEADCLRELGVGYGQGFLYWKPMPIADLVACSAR